MGTGRQHPAPPSSAAAITATAYSLRSSGRKRYRGMVSVIAPATSPSRNTGAATPTASAIRSPTLKA